MRIKVVGENLAAGTLRGYTQKLGFAVVDSKPDFTIEYRDGPPGDFVIDSVDSVFESRVVHHLERLGGKQFVLIRAGGVRNENSMVMVYPRGSDEIAARAVIRACQEAMNFKKIHEPRRRSWLRKLWPFIFLLLAPGELLAQQYVYGRAWDSVNLAAVDPGDSTNRAIRVNMVSGTISGADGSILDGVAPSIKATVFDYINSNPLSVRLTDTNGDYVAPGGGGSSFGSAFPATGSAGGFYDGTNMQGARVFDINSTGGTEYVLGVNLRQAAGGGSIEVGIQSNPLYFRSELVAGTGTITAISQGIANGNSNTPSTWTVEITGTWTGTIEFQGRISASSGVYYATTAVNDSTGAIVTNTTGNGVFRVPGGWDSFRVFSTAWASGTANIYIQPGGVSNVFLSKSLPAGSAVIGAVTQSGTWTVTGAGGTFPVTGTFWQATQPVSGTFWQTTQPISIDQTGNNNAVDVLTLPNVTVGTFPDNEPFNVAQRGAVAVVAGACERESLLYVQISQTGSTQIIAGTASERIYICSLQLVTATAQNIALVDGTGGTCVTSPTGLLGGSTAATGWNFAANGGIVLPPTRDSWTKTSTDADNVCLLQSGAGQVSGSITYISIPNI